MDEERYSLPRMMRAAHFWRRHSWFVIGASWVVTLVLGYIGFRQNALTGGRSSGFTDLAYRTLQLIFLGSGDPPAGEVTLALDVARFLIPFLAALTAIRAFLFLFHERWQQLLVRFWRGHVIICGLSRKGWLLAQGFAAHGDRVVVIETDEASDLIGPCRERGIVVLAGDAADPDLLRRAGVLRAGHLVAVTDDDGVNAEIAVRTQGVLRESALGGDHKRVLTCTVHLVDPQLYYSESDKDSRSGFSAE